MKDKWWLSSPVRRPPTPQMFPFTPKGILVPTSKGDNPLQAGEIEATLVGLRGQRLLFLMGLVQWGQAMKEFVYGR